jgi:hypothetical protein
MPEITGFVLLTNGFCDDFRILKCGLPLLRQDYTNIVSVRKPYISLPVIPDTDPESRFGRDLQDLDPGFASTPLTSTPLGSTTLTAGSASSTSHRDDPLHG